MSTAVPAGGERALRPSVVPPRKLADLAVGLDLRVPAGAGAVAVGDITLDSRQVGPGCLYVALAGTRTHGANFAAQAVRA
ncbi:Mur ligase domain-containing protein, partial [uncultured Propionibacterium sp.]|uniref:Mur ligase domain-containing protein n=1 Tax=uncultured Propionibacterium sp. TaxID=218066 RepID=UPI00293077C1